VNSSHISSAYAHEGLWYKCQPVLKGETIDEHCGDPTGRSKLPALV